MLTRFLRKFVFAIATLGSMMACNESEKKCDEIIKRAKDALSMIPKMCWEKNLSSLQHAVELSEMDSKDSIRLGFDSLITFQDRWYGDLLFDAILIQAARHLVQVNPLDERLASYLLYRWENENSQGEIVRSMLFTITLALEEDFHRNVSLYDESVRNDSTCTNSWLQHGRVSNIIEIRDHRDPLNYEYHYWRLVRARAVKQIITTCPDSMLPVYQKAGFAEVAYLDYLENDKLIEAAEFAKKIGFADTTLMRLGTIGSKLR